MFGWSFCECIMSVWPCFGSNCIHCLFEFICTIELDKRCSWRILQICINNLKGCTLFFWSQCFKEYASTFEFFFSKIKNCHAYHLMILGVCILKIIKFVVQVSSLAFNCLKIKWNLFSNENYNTNNNLVQIKLCLIIEILMNPTGGLLRIRIIWMIKIHWINKSSKF